LGEESEDAGTGLAASRQIMIVEFGQFAAIGDGVKIEIDEFGIGEQERGDTADPVCQESFLMGTETAIGVIGGEGLFGKDIEAGEEAEGGVEVEIVDMAASFLVEKFEDEEAEQSAGWGNHVGARVARLLAELIEAELREEGEKEKQAGDRRAQGFFGGRVEDPAVGDSGRMRSRRVIMVRLALGPSALWRGKKGGVCPSRIWAWN
jgi:hypothetical protein